MISYNECVPLTDALAKGRVIVRICLFSSEINDDRGGDGSKTIYTVCEIRPECSRNFPNFLQIPGGKLEVEDILLSLIMMDLSPSQEESGEINNFEQLRLYLMGLSSLIDISKLTMTVVVNAICREMEQELGRKLADYLRTLHNKDELLFVDLVDSGGYPTYILTAVVPGDQQVLVKESGVQFKMLDFANSFEQDLDSVGKDESLVIQHGVTFGRSSITRGDGSEVVNKDLIPGHYQAVEIALNVLRRNGISLFFS